MNDLDDLLELLPTDLVDRFPDAEERIYWIKENYGVSLALAFKVNKSL